MEQTINYRGFEIEIKQDNAVESPDSWGNDDVFIVYDHWQFSVRRKGYEPSDIFDSMENGYRPYDGYHVFTLYAYIHSGVSLSLGRGNDRFDTSSTGYVLVKKTKGWSWRHEKARKIAESTVETWNDYLSGNVYGYNIEGTGDSCWGFYGDVDKSGIIDEAKSSVDYHIKSQHKSHFEQLKKWIKSKVPVLYRQPCGNAFALMLIVMMFISSCGNKFYPGNQNKYHSFRNTVAIDSAGVKHTVKPKH